MDAPPTAPLPLIAGAGPVGLAAALFLARAGKAVRLIDMATERRTHSRALVVNPRTLHLLEPTGITGQMLVLGKPIRGVNFWADGRVIGQAELDQLPGKYPFLLALSQSVTERLLTEAAAAAGVTVERGTALADCHPVDGGVAVELHRDGGENERFTAPWLLAADGAHSVARSAMDVAFRGSTFPREWHLADVPMRTTLAEDRAHILFLPGGRFVFCLRVIDDQQPPTAAPLWRVMGNVRDPVSKVPVASGAEAAAAGPPVWTSSFRIEHRLAETLQRGPIALAGDAAHVHSPVGARGMNLGVEDAWVFARLVAAGRLAEYGKLRRRVDKKVVRRIAAVSRMAKGESFTSRLLRRWGLPAMLKLPAARRQLLATVSGVDHELPAV